MFIYTLCTKIYILSFIAYPISTLINRSIETGYVPEALNIPKILPLYKSKEQHKMTSYRPIPIFLSISKVIEKVIHKRVYSFLNDNIHHLIPCQTVTLCLGSWPQTPSGLKVK